MHRLMKVLLENYFDKIDGLFIAVAAAKRNA